MGKGREGIFIYGLSMSSCPFREANSDHVKHVNLSFSAIYLLETGKMIQPNVGGFELRVTGKCVIHIFTNIYNVSSLIILSR